MRLSDLKTGERGVIVKVKGHGGFRKRIVEMGFIKGKSVDVLLNAPLQDPVKYKIMGYEVSLRRSEADNSEVVSTEEAKMLSDKFNEMYTNGTKLGNEASLKAQVSTQTSIEDLIGEKLGADVRTVKRSGAPGIGSAMFIRGLNSLNANAQPLIVLDGVPMDMQYDGTSLQTGMFNNQLLNINPADIEKVTVL